MTLEKYLILTPMKKGYRKLDARMVSTVSKITIPGNSVVLKLDIEIPDSIFTKPQLHAKITVPADKVSKPFITAESVSNIEEIINKQLNADITITVVNELNHG